MHFKYITPDSSATKSARKLTSRARPLKRQTLRSRNKVCGRSRFTETAHEEKLVARPAHRFARRQRSRNAGWLQAVYFLIRPGPGALIKPLKQAGKRKHRERSRFPSLPPPPFFLFLRLVPHARNVPYTYVRGAAAVLGFLINKHPVDAKRITARRRSPGSIITTANNNNNNKRRNY